MRRHHTLSWLSLNRLAIRSPQSGANKYKSVELGDQLYLLALHKNYRAPHGDNKLQSFTRSCIVMRTLILTYCSAKLEAADYCGTKIALHCIAKVPVYPIIVPSLYLWLNNPCFCECQCTFLVCAGGIRFQYNVYNVQVDQLPNTFCGCLFIRCVCCIELH